VNDYAYQYEYEYEYVQVRLFRFLFRSKKANTALLELTVLSLLRVSFMDQDLAIGWHDMRI
jgi:hypothetical protein